MRQSSRRVFNRYLSNAQRATRNAPRDSGLAVNEPSTIHPLEVVKAVNALENTIRHKNRRFGKNVSFFDEITLHFIGQSP
ncbi:hypothetical protein AL486_04935 [Pandoraea apista]|nr:hypothetical protein AL486_04935 [Pandoraea apista]